MPYASAGKFVPGQGRPVPLARTVTGLRRHVSLTAAANRANGSGSDLGAGDDRGEEPNGGSSTPRLRAPSKRWLEASSAQVLHQVPSIWPFVLVAVGDISESARLSLSTVIPVEVCFTLLLSSLCSIAWRWHASRESLATRTPACALLLQQEEDESEEDVVELREGVEHQAVVPTLQQAKPAGTCTDPRAGGRSSTP
jgi:hypothetical protein